MIFGGPEQLQFSWRQYKQSFSDIHFEWEGTYYISMFIEHHTSGLIGSSGLSIRHLVYVSAAHIVPLLGLHHYACMWHTVNHLHAVVSFLVWRPLSIYNLLVIWQFYNQVFNVLHSHQSPLCTRTPSSWVPTVRFDNAVLYATNAKATNPLLKLTIDHL